MLPEPKVSLRLLEGLRSAEREVRRLRDAASAEGVKSTGLEVGQVVRDQDTGTRYAIKSCYVWVRENDCEPQLSIMGVRIYKTGRRPARSQTILTGRRFILETSDDA